MTDPPAWFAELALTPLGPPWLAMGLNRITEEQWLLPGDERAVELAERHRLLVDRHAEVFAALDGTEDAGEEVLALVLAWERAFRPDLADVPILAGVHPLEAAGRRTQEDLALMVRRDGRHHLDAAVLCFPSHWRLREKIGGTATAIHGPVPGYDPELAPRVDRFLDRLRPDVVVARRNWSVHTSPDLFAPDVPPSQPLAAGDVGTTLWLRSERQTLRLLPRTDVILFSIRVQQAPFAALADAPEIAAALARRLVAQPSALTAMNGVGPHFDVVVPWLDAIGDGHPVAVQ